MSERSHSVANYGNFFRAARAARQGQPATPTTDIERARAAVRKTRRKSKKPLPAGAIFFAILILAGAAWCLVNIDQMEQMLSKVDVTVFGSAVAEDKAAKTDEKPGKKEPAAESKKEKSAETDSAKSAAKDVVPKTFTPEQMAVFNKLEERRKALDFKEQELQKLEEELQKQKSLIEARFKELDQMRDKISERLNEKVKVDQEKVSQLVEVYSNMKAQNAAKVFEEINEDLAVEVLGKMKKKNMADILNLLKPDKAQRLSEKFAGYKRQ
jgi:flagellar motility protein MotE (MotC chaperone)